MPKIIRNFEGQPDPFFAHPASEAFMIATEKAYQETGQPIISADILDEIQYAFALPEGELKAMDYLAKKRFDEEIYG